MLSNYRGREGGRRGIGERTLVRERERGGGRLVKFYFSTVKILAYRPTDISAVAKVLYSLGGGGETEGETEEVVFKPSPSRPQVFFSLIVFFSSLL